MEEIVYERRYPRLEWTKEMEKKMVEGLSGCKVPEFDKMYEELMSNIAYVPLMGRIKKSKKFINTVIEFSEMYGIDTKIIKYDNRISAEYSFDCIAGRADIKNLFCLADEITISAGCSEKEIVLSMEYYTSARLRRKNV